MPDPITATASSTISPEYERLIRFLVEPFLESPGALRLDCERSQSQPRIWIRIAFEGADKGRVFGRGGRNIQAIRMVLDAISKMTGCSVHLDIYGGPPSSSHEGSERESGERPYPRRPGGNSGGNSRGPSRPRR